MGNSVRSLLSKHMWIVPGGVQCKTKVRPRSDGCIVPMYSGLYSRGTPAVLLCSKLKVDVTAIYKQTQKLAHFDNTMKMFSVIFLEYRPNCTLLEAASSWSIKGHLRSLEKHRCVIAGLTSNAWFGFYRFRAPHLKSMVNLGSTCSLYLLGGTCNSTAQRHPMGAVTYTFYTNSISYTSSSKHKYTLQAGPTCTNKSVTTAQDLTQSRTFV